MLMSGKMLGFSLRRLSWAELGFLIMLVHTVLPHASPYFVPALRAIAAAVIRKGYAWKCHAVAAARAAALTAITGVAARISVHDATVVDQDSTDRRQFLQAALDKIEPGAAVPVVTAASGMVVMPIGNISAAVLPVGLADHSSALCDDGATIDCFLTLDGVIPGTFDKSQGGPLTIGDKSSSLSSNGVYLYAIERCGANGTCQDELFLGHHTPNGVANIMSESREVNVRQTRLEWCPGMARQFHTKHGASIPLIMGPNGLGFLTVKPITDRKRIVKLLLQSPLTPKWLREQMAPVVLTSSMLAQATTTPSLTQVELIDEIAPLHTVEMPTTTLLSPPICTIEGLRLPVPVNMAAPVLARQLAGATTLEDVSILAMIAMNDISFDSYVAAVTAASMALSGVGLAGKLLTLSPFMTLVRVHCLLGHATLNTCLATIACATSLPKGFITREAIREYLATKCGICESAKMRRRTFRLDLSGVKDHTVPEVGKQYVFDTLGLRVPSAQWGYINITRFNDRNPKGIKRSYGHISMDAETFEKLILTFRAFNRPYKGEILVI
jgi:hypothetical protein